MASLTITLHNPPATFQCSTPQEAAAFYLAIAAASVPQAQPVADGGGRLAPKAVALPILIPPKTYGPDDLTYEAVISEFERASYRDTFSLIASKPEGMWLGEALTASGTVPKAGSGFVQIVKTIANKYGVPMEAILVLEERRDGRDRMKWAITPLRPPNSPE